MPNLLHTDNKIKYNVDRRQMYNQPNFFHKLKMFFLNFGVQKHKRFYFISFDIDMEVEGSGHVLLMQYSLSFVINLYDFIYLKIRYFYRISF